MAGPTPSEPVTPSFLRLPGSPAGPVARPTSVFVGGSVCTGHHGIRQHPRTGSDKRRLCWQLVHRRVCSPFGWPQRCSLARLAQRSCPRGPPCPLNQRSGRLWVVRAAVLGCTLPSLLVSGAPVAQHLDELVFDITCVVHTSSLSDPPHGILPPS